MSNQVLYSKKGDVHTFETGVAGLQTFVVDHSGVPAEEGNGLAKQLLASSALACYGSMLAGALEAREVPYTSMNGKASFTMGPNKAGQGRVKSMHLEFTVELPENAADGFERCAKIMKNGCLVTGSLHEGMELSYALEPKYTN